jgi:hypothetical protein
VLLVSHNLIDPQFHVSLDYESRFFGKEIIGLFVNRFGKSSMAALLLLVTNLNGFFTNDGQIVRSSLVSFEFALAIYRVPIGS